ncbi:MAG: transcription antitermination factor NusB [Eubacterium sp.]|nr:transcription antitermination factor NusB [Eubacterium sp.]
MIRTQLRETIFRLLFMNQFNGKEEMKEQVTLYLDEMRAGLVEMPFASYENKEEERENNPAFANAEDVTQEDEKYIREKLEKILDRIPEIDERLNEASRNWKTTRMGKVDLSVLRLAVYELLYDESVPTGVAIDEAVEIAKHYGGDESGAFVNGVLGHIARDLPDAKNADQGQA